MTIGGRESGGNDRSLGTETFIAKIYKSYIVDCRESQKLVPIDMAHLSTTSMVCHITDVKGTVVGISVKDNIHECINMVRSNIPELSSGVNAAGERISIDGSR